MKRFSEMKKKKTKRSPLFLNNSSIQQANVPVNKAEQANVPVNKAKQENNPESQYLHDYRDRSANIYAGT